MLENHIRIEQQNELILFVTSEGLRVLADDFADADFSAARQAPAEATPSLSYSFLTHFQVSCMYFTSSLCWGSIRPDCDFCEWVAVFLLVCTWNTGFGELHHHAPRVGQQRQRKRGIRLPVIRGTGWMRLNAHLKTSGENDLSDEESRCPELLLSAIVCGTPAAEGRGRETKGQRWIKIHDNVQSLAMIASLMFGRKTDLSSSSPKVSCSHFLLAPHTSGQADVNETEKQAVRDSGSQRVSCFCEQSETFSRKVQHDSYPHHTRSNTQTATTITSAGPAAAATSIHTLVSDI